MKSISQNISDKNDIFADKPDISIDVFIQNLLDNDIIPHKDGTVDILVKSEKSMKKFPSIKDAYDAIHDSMIAIHDYQNICWDELADIIKQIVHCNTTEKMSDRVHYYKNESIKMIRDLIKAYGKQASDFIDVPEYLSKTNLINSDMICSMYKTLMKIVSNNYLMGLENYRCLLLNLLQSLIIKEMGKTAAFDSGVMGPFSNLDLPMLERVVPWNIVGEGLQGREDEIRSLPRYNPQYIGGIGVYTVFWEPTMGGYSFDDVYRDEGVYKTRVVLRK